MAALLFGVFLLALAIGDGLFEKALDKWPVLEKFLGGNL